MKKIKIEEKIENSVNAFFETGEKSESSLAYAADSSLIQNNESVTFTNKFDDSFSKFKKVLLFLPGVFLLYSTSLASVFFYKDLGFTFWMAFWFVLGSAMIWAGLGDIRNKKHFLMPASVAALSFALALAFSFLPESVQPSIFLNYSIYIFPFALIVPVLVKSLLDKAEEV